MENKDADIVMRAILFELLRLEFGFDYKKSTTSERNIKALQKMYDEISLARKRLGKYKRKEIRQLYLVRILLKESSLKRKRRQKIFLRKLAIGRKVELEEFKKILPVKKSRGQKDNRWKNSISQLKRQTEITLNEYSDYFNISINTYGSGASTAYQLTIGDKDKFPYRIVR